MGITNWYVGQTQPPFTGFFADDNGNGVNLTGATLSLTIRSKSGSRPDTAGAGTFTIVTTLAALTGSTIAVGATVTALPCSAGTSVALPPGAQIICSAGTSNAETFTYSGTAMLPSGATSIPVVSQVAAKTHTAADNINGLGLAVYNWNANDSATADSYLLYFKATNGASVYNFDPILWIVNAF